ncbi:MAG: hypothetical protein WA666_12300 [Nitrospirota bacterium]
MTGTGTPGTTDGYLTGHFTRTGEAGIMIDIGGKKAGASEAIDPHRERRDRN